MPDMERLLFICPNTRRDRRCRRSTTEIGTLLRIKSETLRARCPACGQTHEWKVRDATLPQGRVSIIPKGGNRFRSDGARQN